MFGIFLEQPPAFRMIFLLELWERFGFYTVQGILTLYFIKYLGYNDAQAYYTFGAYSALVYGLVVVGGYLGDKVLGSKRTIALGLIVLASGYFFLAFTDKAHVFWALALICVGNGLFKANPSKLLSLCYEEQDPRLHGAFTLYYMAINLGSIVALFMGPYLSSTYGYSYAYFSSGIGLVLGLANYCFQYKNIASINTRIDKQKVPLETWGLVLAVILALTAGSCYLLQHVFLAKNLLWCIILMVLCIYFYWMRQYDRAYRRNMLVALILMLEAITFFTLYQQMPTSINLFAVNNVNPYFLGIPIDPQSFQVLNPIWIVLMSPILALIYDKLHKRGIVFSVPYKFALGMTMGAFSFVILYAARFFYVDNGMVSSWWLILSYWFQSIAELLISALGVAMVAELVPKSIAGFVMGVWFLTSAISGFLGATLASYTALPQHITPGKESLMIYTEVFAWIGIITFIISIVLWIIAPHLHRWISHHHASKIMEHNEQP